MIFTEKQLQYLAELPSSVAHALPSAPNPDVPFFLDDPVIRKEMSHYYSSVRRADDCVGEVLKALAESGQADRTAIVFLSDHGMPLPFAKTELYHHSTRTPLIVVWPGVTKPGAVDRTHMVSAVDFMPTLCRMLGLTPPSPMDGRSFAPLLRGEEQTGRDMIFKEYKQKNILRYIIATLFDDDDPHIRADRKGLIFFDLKTVMDCLDQ